jgi:hypothetical protein
MDKDKVIDDLRAEVARLQAALEVEQTAAEQGDGALPPLTMTLYGTREALETERELRAALAQRAWSAKPSEQAEAQGKPSVDDQKDADMVVNAICSPDFIGKPSVTVDTPLFRVLLDKFGYVWELVKTPREDAARVAIISHIDAHTARAVAEAIKQERARSEVDAGALGIACTINKKLGDVLAGRAYLLPDDLAALKRFHECASDFDSGGHDVSRQAMSRLTEIGVCRHLGFGNHQTTSFGDYILERDVGEAVKLPLKTLLERNSDAAIAVKGN